MLSMLWILSLFFNYHINLAGTLLALLLLRETPFLVISTTSTVASTSVLWWCSNLYHCSKVLFHNSVATCEYPTKNSIPKWTVFSYYLIPQIHPSCALQVSWNDTTNQHARNLGIILELALFHSPPFLIDGQVLLF